MNMFNFCNPTKRKRSIPGRVIGAQRGLLCVALLAVALPAASQAIDLFPKNYAEEWTRVSIPPSHPLGNTSQWHINPSKHEILCDGNGGHEWLRFNHAFRNFTFHAKWRFTKLEGSPKYNSGIFFRNSEVGSIWHQAQTSPDGGYLFGETLVDGKLTPFNERKSMKENRIKPPGQWNTYDIRCVADKCTLAVNGAEVNTIQISAEKGYVGLEAEGYRIEFKNLTVLELP
jgi:hypothetical protein